MKKGISLLLSILFLLSCAACGAKEEPPEVEAPKEEPAILNPLTGLPLHDPASLSRRPVAVMLNNIHVAMPQHGVSTADMIFEYNVESEITRMIGFYQEVEKAGIIGSVRSARPYFVDTALGMDAIYVHAGGSTEAYNMMYNLDMDDIDEPDFDCFWRDEERAQTMAFEHTLMTSGQRLADYTKANGWRLEHKEGYTYPVTFVADGTPKNGTPATDIAVTFSGYKTGTFTYDPDTMLYRIGQYDAPYIDGNTAKQVGVTNLLVLRTSVTNSGDSKGHMDIVTTGSGEGTFFCGGKAIDMQWHKEAQDDPFTFTLPDGSDLPLGAGRTYVCVVDNDAPVRISGE